MTENDKGPTQCVCGAYLIDLPPTERFIDSRTEEFVCGKCALKRRGGGGGGPDCGVAIIQSTHTGGGGLGDAVWEFVQMVPAIDTAEAPPPYALTAAQLPGLERAIRAEGYSVLADTESGEVLLMKPTEDKRLRAPVGRMEQALRAILSRIQFGGEPYPGLIEQLCKEGLGE